MDPVEGEQLTAALARAARSVLRGRLRSPEDVLAEVVAAARAVPGADGAGITQVGRDGRVSARVPSSSWVAELDRRQADLGEGPCVLASRIALGVDEMSTVVQVAGHDQVIEVADMAVTGRMRWPRWAGEAVAAGVGSLLSFAMAPPEEPGSALNFYARETDAFTEVSVLAGEAFATQTAIALFGARRAAQMHRAMQSRDVIDRAKGVLIERFDVDDDQAFAILVEASQNTDAKLVDVAREVSTQAQRRHH